MSIISIDLETTGFLSKSDDIREQPHIIEIGAVKFDSQTFEEIETYEQLIKPPIPLPEEITEITGISSEDLQEQPSFLGQFKHLTKFFVGASTVLTFNGEAFDLEVLRWELQRVGYLMRFPWPPIRIDLMLSSTDYIALSGKSGNKFPKLIELYQHLFEKEFENQHRAIHDARATMDCYVELRKRNVL